MSPNQNQGNKVYAPFIADDDTPKYFTKPMSPNIEKNVKPQEKSRNANYKKDTSRLHSKNSQLNDARIPFVNSPQFKD